MNKFPVRTTCKIVFCQNCFGPVPARYTTIDTQEQLIEQIFCNDFCRDKALDHESKRPSDTKLMYVYLNKNMLDLAKSNGVRPAGISFFIWSGHELVGIAQYDEAELNTISDREANTYDAWYRPISQLNISIEEDYRPRIMRDYGLLAYLSDEIGISAERNIAAAIGTISDIEGHDSPIMFFDTL